MDKTQICHGIVIASRITEPNDKGKRFQFVDVKTDLGLVCHFRFVPLSLGIKEGDVVEIFVDYDYNYNFTIGIKKVE